MKPKILLIGKNGQIGAELERSLSGSSELLPLGRAELDLTNPEDIRRSIRQFRPDVIVNAAAYTAVDQAESNEASARAINAEAPLTMAEEADRIGAALLHYSTDYVFDGQKTTPYREDDPPNPLNAYGRTKLAGERAIQSAAGRYVILRTAWVYGTRGKNFLLTILRLATQREELRIVSDQIGAPVWSRAIASATAKMINEEWNRCLGTAPFLNSTGIYHMTASGQTNWCEFAEAILSDVKQIPPGTAWLEAATNKQSVIVKSVSAIGTADYPTRARRPAYSILSNSKLENTFGVRLGDWRTQLRVAVKDAEIF